MNKGPEAAEPQIVNNVEMTEVDDPMDDTWTIQRNNKHAEKGNTERIENVEEKYVVFIKGNTTNLTKKNSVKLEKAINEVIGKPEKIYVSGKESLKIYATNEAQRRKILETTAIGDMEISASLPIKGYNTKEYKHKPTIKNTIRGVITSVPEEDGADDIGKETEAVRAYRLTKSINGQRKPTGTIVLTFDGDELPKFVRYGFRQYKVYQYNPTPIRCYNCQDYGHQAKVCRAQIVCPACSERHKYEDCPTKTVRKCANCQGNHTAAYKGCIKYKAAEQIYREAEVQRISYAAAARKRIAENKAKTKEVSIQETQEETISQQMEQSKNPKEIAVANPAPNIETQQKTETTKTTTTTKPAENKAASTRHKGKKTKRHRKPSSSLNTSDEEDTEKELNSDFFRKEKPSPPPKRTKTINAEECTKAPSMKEISVFIVNAMTIMTTDGLVPGEREIKFVELVREIFGLEITDLPNISKSVNKK